MMFMQNQISKSQIEALESRLVLHAKLDPPTRAIFAQTLLENGARIDQLPLLPAVMKMKRDKLINVLIFCPESPRFRQ